MLVLALDTATSAVTTGVVWWGAAGSPQALAERVTVDPRAHAELLMPSVRAVLATAEVAMGALDALVCGVGPGPFTGLRVGMVTAAALGDALGLPVYPVGSLDAIAHRAGPGPSLLVATDARRREIYWARYDERGSRTAGPGVNAPVEVPLDGVARLAGAAAPALRDFAQGNLAQGKLAQGKLAQGELALGDLKRGVSRLAVVAPEYPDPAALVAVAGPALRAQTPPDPLIPRYLRRPDALEPGPRKRVTPV